MIEDKKDFCFLLTGISASGKTSIIYKLLEKRPDLNLEKIITSTSRKMRPNEINGVDYYFYSNDEMIKMKEDDEFFEVEEVYGNIYGSEKKEVDRIKNSGHIPFFVCDVKGAKTFTKIIENIISIYVLPDSFEHLKNRIENRPGSTDETTFQRLREIEEELKFVDDCDYCIINREGKLDEAVFDLENIVISCTKNEKMKLFLSGEYKEEVSKIICDMKSKIENFKK